VAGTSQGRISGGNTPKQLRPPSERRLPQDILSLSQQQSFMRVVASAANNNALAAVMSEGSQEDTTSPLRSQQVLL
jgi:hypothetical protein